MTNYNMTTNNNTEFSYMMKMWMDEWSLYYYKKILETYETSRNMKLCYENMCHLHFNSNITWNTVKTLEHEKWNYDALSFNPNITWEIVQQNPDKPWNYSYLSMNPNITWEIVKNNKHMKWDYYYLSRNKNITIDIIHEEDDEKWSMSMFCRNNPNIDIEIFKKYKLHRFSLFFASNPRLKWTDILDNYETFCNTAGILTSEVSLNPNITWEIVQSHPDIQWNWDMLSLNPNITWEIIQQNPNDPWNWELLAKNPNITWEIIQQNPDKHWDIKMFSENPNISFENVMEMKEQKYFFGGLFANSFDREREMFLRNKMQEWFIHSSLKEELMMTMWHPRNMKKWNGWGFDDFEEDDENKY